MLTFTEALAACRAAWGDPSHASNDAADWDASEWTTVHLTPGRLAVVSVGMGDSPDEVEAHTLSDAATLADAVDAVGGYFRRAPPA